MAQGSHSSAGRCIPPGGQPVENAVSLLSRAAFATCSATPFRNEPPRKTLIGRPHAARCDPGSELKSDLRRCTHQVRR